MKKRILSIVLTLCMVLMLVPTTAFAEGITPATPQTDTDGVYQIGTAEELYGFAQLVNNGNTSASAVLTADITVNSNLLNSLNEDGTVKDGATVTSWTPIGNNSNKYTGKFDGQGHTISGLYFNDADKSYVGLFGILGENGEIKNVGVIDSYFNGYLSVGGVCGKNTGIITGCYNTGEVSGVESVGGVCGESFGTITGCYNTGEVSGNYSVGGVCGRNVGGTITGCYNTGTVSGTGNYVGGVCGYNTDAGYDTIGTITGSYNTGEVSGVESVGGVCGYEYKRCKIIGSYNTGTVSGVKYIGGVCGYEDNRCTIIGSYNTGTVSGTGNYVGGVCGFNFVGCIITGCYTNNGGVYGENNNGTVTDCDVMSDDEFADATVCKLLNTVLQNASSDVRFCQRIGKDASPLLTYQFDSIDDHTDDNPKDHICDICGERLSDHTGIDENPKDHLCDICAETLSNHTGGEATCTAKAECEYCGAEYGELDSSNHTGGTEIRGAKDATCTEEGYTGDTYCKGCGAKLSTGTAINMLDHNLVNTPAKDATASETGNKEYWHCLDCDKCFADENGTDEITLDDTVISKLPPEIIEGEGQSITEGELKELIFRSNAAFSDFIRVELDGKTLDEKNYTVKEGSTVVTLKADYVATLSAGEHTIGIVSASGTATTTFTVNVKAVVDNDTKSPQTGDNSHMALWIALLFVSGAGVIGTTVYGKKKRVR